MDITKTKVVETRSRVLDNGSVIRRRRQPKEGGDRITTYEVSFDDALDGLASLATLTGTTCLYSDIATYNIFAAHGMLFIRLGPNIAWNLSTQDMVSFLSNEKVIGVVV